MGISLLLSSIAILISVISLTWFIYIGFRDRGNLKTSSKLIRTKGGVYLQVKAVNYGRRPVILTALGINFPTGSAIHACGKGPVLRLGENESFEENITSTFSYMTLDNGEIEKAIDIWIEDSLGQRYKVKDAKQHLKKI